VPATSNDGAAAAQNRPGAEGSAAPSVDNSGRTGAGRGGRPGGDAAGADASAQGDTGRRNRFGDRTQNMSPEEREAMLERMRARGIDPNSPQGGRGGGPGGPGAQAGARFGRGGPAQAAQSNAGGAAPRSGRQGAPTAAPSGGATTIDALFAPLPRPESIGRAWVFTDGQLHQMRLRLGVTDGQTTELVEGELKEGDAVVTNVALAGQSTRPAATNAFPGFGPQGGRGPGGFPGGGGGGGRGR
jgi:hypothetical protein